MSPRARVTLIAAAAAALAAGGTVALAVLTAKDKGGPSRPPQPLAGTPPLALDLGVRVDAEARALRRAGRLYDRKRLATAGRIFARYDSVDAQVGDAFSAWPDTSLLRLPSFSFPAQLTRLPAPQQLAALARAARRPDVRAKLLYGLALQRLGHRLAARREYDAAAKLAPGDPEAQVAAAVGHFDKSRPADAFSRLGPLTRRFPHAATVRFHLGLLLFWLSRVQPGAVAEGERQLRLAEAVEPGSPLAREAKRFLVRLERRAKQQ